MATSQKMRAIIFLLDLFNNATNFHPVTHDKDTGYPSIDDGESVEIASVFTNEVLSRWEESRRGRLKDSRERSAWAFQVLLTFPQEVLLEFFEKSITETVPKLAATSELRQCRFLLQNAEITHPVQQQSEGGTKVVYTFSVEEGRL